MPRESIAAHGSSPAADNETGRAERVADLEFADQAEALPPGHAERDEFGDLTVRFGLHRDQAQLLSVAAVIDNRASARPAGFGEEVELRAVGIQHGGAARREELAKETQLGGAIGVERNVVIEMVAGQVGETGGGKRDTVEPALGKPVAGRLERRALDPRIGERREIPMQRDGVGRRQGPGALAGRADDTECADRGRPQAGRAPDLTREGHHGGLAVGAGHGNAALGRIGVEARGDLGQAAARIGIDDRSDPALGRAEVDRFGNQDRGRAARYGVGDEIPAIRRQARQGREQEAGPDLPRIAGDPRDLDIASRRPAGHVRAKKINETQASGSLAAPSRPRAAFAARSAATVRRRA